MQFVMITLAGMLPGVGLPAGLGATAADDLAYKMIFPALCQMVKRGTLGVPVVGVACSGWGLPQLRDHARDSIAQGGAGIDDGDALGRLLSLVEYIDGDYGDPGTFKALRRVLGGARHPVHYLAIPPSLFATVIGLGYRSAKDVTPSVARDFWVPS